VPWRTNGGIWRPSVDETDNYVSTGALRCFSLESANVAASILDPPKLLGPFWSVFAPSDSLPLQFFAHLRHETHVDEFAQKLDQRLCDDDCGKYRDGAGNCETERQDDE
jgi:hypothetical protein